MIEPMKKKVKSNTSMEFSKISIKGPVYLRPKSGQIGVVSVKTEKGGFQHVNLHNSTFD